jgi:hypothetical protein
MVSTPTERFFRPQSNRKLNRVHEGQWNLQLRRQIAYKGADNLGRINRRAGPAGDGRFPGGRENHISRYILAPECAHCLCFGFNEAFCHYKSGNGVPKWNATRDCSRFGCSVRASPRAAVRAYLVPAHGDQARCRRTAALEPKWALSLM